MRLFSVATFLVAALVFLGFGPSALAEGRLSFTTSRVVIEPGQRNGEAVVRNTTEKPMRVRVSLQDYSMNTAGVTILTEKGPYSAQAMIRYMPRFIELKPGERQTIRILVKRPTDLADGDYRTHLTFTEIPQVDTTKPNETQATDNNRASFKIDFNMAAAIPIIVQQGKLESKTVIESATFVRDANQKPTDIQVTLKRTGNAEGSLIIRGVLADGVTKATKDRLVRIYRDVDHVTIKIPVLPAVAEGSPNITLGTFTVGGRADNKTPLQQVKVK